MSRGRSSLPEVTFDALRDHPLMRGLSDETVSLFVAELPHVVFEPGQALMTEGDMVTDMFVIIAGEIEVLTSGTHGNVRVALLGPGDWVGDMAILDVQPRSASVRALAPALALKVTAEDVKRLTRERDLEQYALLVANVAKELSRRLRVADRLIANSGATMAREYVHLSTRPPAG